MRFWIVIALLAVSTTVPGQSGPENETTWEDTTEQALSDISCPDAEVLGTGLMTKVCWDCIFPIRIGGQAGFGGGDVPEGAASNALCACGPGEGTSGVGKIGVTVGFFQPSRLIETTDPMCFPALGGVNIDKLADATGSLRLAQHGIPGSTDSNTLNFAQFHYYAFPLTAILGLFDSQQCLDQGFSDLDLLFFSETMPNWHDSRLSALINPEVAMFAGLTSAAVQPVDCIASSFDEPIDELYWVAGCWGAIYNPTGYGHRQASPVGFSSLLATRALHLLSRIGFIERRMGDDAVCEGQRTPLLVKSMYRLQMMFPSAEASSGLTGGRGFGGDGAAVSQTGGGQFEITPNTDTCCHPIGQSTLMWGEWRSRAHLDEYVWLLWKWTDCCIGYDFQ